MDNINGAALADIMQEWTKLVDEAVVNSL